MKLSEAYEKLNTIYIISKGRPRCLTARTLTRIGYPGQWFIVCGNNDNTIEKYQQNWGKDKILIFDWYEEVKHTDFMDNLGVEKYSSGAAPVRNATMEISRQRGEIRHWQLDDDYPAFVKFNTKRKKYDRVRDGRVLQFEMAKIALFGYEADLTNVGYQPTSNTYPDQAFNFTKRVFNAHNLPSDPDKFVRWRARMNDDTVNALDVLVGGGYEISVNYLGMGTIKTQTETGGNTDLYKDNGTVMKTAYAVMRSPKSVSLVIKFKRYHHQNNWAPVSPKLIRDHYARL
jgi:hypothetical protein